MNAATTLSQARGDERTHLFLVATMVAGPATLTVRVRNLSPSGALVEAKELPARGTRVVLRRGSLQAEGIAVWVAAGRAGLKFDAPLHVSAWLPTRDGARNADTAAAALAAAPRAVPPALPAAPAKDALAADLASLLGEMTVLGELLANDPRIAGDYPQLQWFDSAAQRLARMINDLRSPAAS